MKKLIAVSILAVLVAGCSTITKKDLDAAYLLGCADTMRFVEETLPPEDVEILKKSYSMERFRTGMESARATIYPH